METISFHVTLPVRLEQKEDAWLGYCDVLDIVTQAPSKEVLKINLRDAIQGFIESCYARGVLERVLKESGFESLSDELVAENMDDDERTIDVPFSLSNARTRNAEAVPC